MSSANVEMSIILPCLNEAETLQTVIEKAFVGGSKTGKVFEIIVADNGSTDGSIDIALKLGARVISVENKGYGSAILGGIEAANGETLVVADADDSYEVENLSKFIEKIDSGYDLVVGNRFKGGIEKGAMPFLHKYIGNPILSLIGRVFFKLEIRDFHCGLRVFRKTKFKQLNIFLPGMEFASEMIAKFALANQKITEVPTILRPDGRSRKPHLRTWRDGWRHLKFLLVYSPSWLFYFPGVIFISIAIFYNLFDYFVAIRIFGKEIEIMGTVFASILFMIGSQLIWLEKILKKANFALNSSTAHTAKSKRFFKLEEVIVLNFIIQLLTIFLFSRIMSEWINGYLSPNDYIVRIKYSVVYLSILAVNFISIASSFIIYFFEQFPVKQVQYKELR